jgi:hypothetical protein
MSSSSSLETCRKQLLLFFVTILEELFHATTFLPRKSKIETYTYRPIKKTAGPT